MKVIDAVTGFGGVQIYPGDYVVYPSKSSYSGKCFLTTGWVLECRVRGKRHSVSILRTKTTRDWVTKEDLEKPVSFYNLRSLYKIG